MRAGVSSVAAMALVVSLGALAGCGAEPSAYCKAVERDRSTLGSFGAKQTDAGWRSYADAVERVAAKAPQPIDVQWASLGRATRGVVTAHEEVGFPMQEMDDEKARADLSAGDAEVINKAYQRFNATKPQRTKVVADADETCGIALQEED